MPKAIKYKVRGETAYRFRVTNPTNNKRVKISLGVVRESVANEAGVHIDTLLETYKYQTDFPPALTKWLQRLPDEVYQRLVAAGLVGERATAESSVLGSFLADYHALRATGGGLGGGWTKSTSAKRQQTIDDLNLFFGDTMRMDEITSDDAIRWLNWMIGDAPAGRGLSPATASKKLKDARQFFEHAHEEGIIDRNPFRKIKLPRQDNPERLFYVDRGTISRVLSEIKDSELRLVVALGRFAGFRIPSEAQSLRWSDLNREKKMMRVRSDKKAADATSGHRPCPIFDELIPFLDAMGSPANSGDACVLPTLDRRKNANLRSEFRRAIKRAGVKPWPRIFQNLRASALTDLAERYPLPQVCKWLGNSTRVAERHYFMLKGVELSDVPHPEHKNQEFGPQSESGTKKGTNQGES